MSDRYDASIRNHPYVREHRGSEPGMSATAADPFPRVAGRCPACGSASLFLAAGGHITCGLLKCRQPVALDDLLHGRIGVRDRIWRTISAERDRQDAKWGGVPGIDRRDDHTYAAVLGEEFGEVCKAWLERNIAELRVELVQTAAVAVAWIEEIDRGGARPRPGEAARLYLLEGSNLAALGVLDQAAKETDRLLAVALSAVSGRKQPPPDPIIEWSDLPDGYHIEWVEHPHRAVIQEGDRTKCRRPGCQRPAVMKLRRSNGWWSYCDWHTYGSRIEDGKVLSRRAVRDEENPA